MALPGSPDSLPLAVCYFPLLDLQDSTAEAPRVQRTRHLEPSRGRQQRQPGESASEMPGLKPNPGRTSRELDFHVGREHRLESLKEEIDSHDQIPSSMPCPPCQAPVTCPFAGVLPAMDVSSLTPFFRPRPLHCGPLNKLFLPPSSAACVPTLAIVPWLSGFHPQILTR